jgi:hypothetical protein
MRRIPLELWQDFNLRLAADAKRLGMRPPFGKGQNHRLAVLTQDAVLFDLVRQYVEAVTWFGRRHLAEVTSAQDGRTRK